MRTFHVQVAPHHRSFLNLHSKGWNTIQFLPFGLSLAPAIVHECMDAASLRSVTDGNPYTSLPRRLAHSGPVAGGFDIAQDDPPQPLRLPGASGSTFPRAYCYPANEFRS